MRSSLGFSLTVLLALSLAASAHAHGRPPMSSSDPTSPRWRRWKAPPDRPEPTNGSWRSVSAHARPATWSRWNGAPAPRPNG
ncbi:hypothetical protein ACFQZ4_06505 [Catellatospora coxensis]